VFDVSAQRSLQRARRRRGCGRAIIEAMSLDVMRRETGA